jgi:hypothetical protein
MIQRVDNKRKCAPAPRYSTQSATRRREIDPKNLNNSQEEGGGGGRLRTCEACGEGGDEVDRWFEEEQKLVVRALAPFCSLVDGLMYVGFRV